MSGMKAVFNLLFAYMKRGLLLLMISLLTLLSSASAENSIPQTGWTKAVPAEYAVESDHAGTVEQIVYDTKDYAGDGSDIEKTAYVSTPWISSSFFICGGLRYQIISCLSIFNE